jgi:WD40 repeat protein
VWDVSTGVCERVLEGHTEWISCLCVLSDGRVVSGGSWDSTLRVWDVSTGVCERVLEGHTGRITCLCVLWDGRVVSGSADNTLRVWDVSTGVCLAFARIDGPLQVMCVAGTQIYLPSATGRHVATARLLAHVAVTEAAPRARVP